MFGPSAAADKSAVMSKTTQSAILISNFLKNTLFSVVFAFRLISCTLN